MLGGAVHRRPLATMLQQYCRSPVPAAAFLAVAGVRINAATPRGGDKRRGMHVGGGGGSLWRKPEAGRLKLNFDGSSRQHVSSRSASIGGVVRDHEGRFVLGYAERIGKGSTSSVAELAALRRGLELALEHGWRGRALWVEGDAMAAVDAARGKGRRRVVSGRAKEDRRLCVEIAEMLPLLETDDEEEEDGGIMVVSHVGRAGNTVAHGFARLGHGAARPKVWRGVPPAEVMKHLHRDAQGE